MSSAWAVFLLGLLYTLTLVSGFVSAGTVSDPLTDPVLAVLEVQIILMTPPMVAMMVAVHAYARRDAKSYSLLGLGFMILAAGTTAIVHVVGLTVARRIDPATMPGFSHLFSWEWPSVFYALDILAWDLLLGLSLLFAAPVFRGGRLQISVRVGLIVSGMLSLAGLIGPAVGNMDLRVIGMVGYDVAFPVVALLLALTFHRTGSTPQERERTTPLRGLREPSAGLGNVRAL